MNPHILKAKLISLREISNTEIIKVTLTVANWEFDEIISDLFVKLNYQNYEQMKGLSSFTYLYPFGVELTLKRNMK